MIVQLHSGSVARPAFAAIAALLLATGCSAPAGDGGDDGVPGFGGFQPPAAGAAGAPAAGGAPGINPPGSSPVANTPVTPTTPSGTAGAAGEPTNGGIGLDPAQNGNQNGGQNAGAGGSTMVGTNPNAGAGGSSLDPSAGTGGSNADPNAGNAGAPATPPTDEPPAPSGDCNGAFFCDGFESVAAGASPSAALWRIMVNYGETPASPNVQVSSGNARSGTQALRVEPAGRAGILATVPQNSYFIRAFMQIDNVSIGPVFIGTGTEANDETRFRIQGQSFATINSVGSPSDDAFRPAAANSGNCPECLTLRANEWLCVEMSIDSNTSTATLWIDGVEAAVAGTEAFTPQPANPTLFLGSMDVQGGRTGVWIDDVAVGPTRIGCD